MTLAPERTYTAADLAQAHREGIAEGIRLGFAQALEQMRSAVGQLEAGINPNAEKERNLSKTIAQAGFCTRAQHVLEDVATVRDLVRMQPRAVQRLDGMGTATFRNVNTILKGMGLHLGMKI